MVISFYMRANKHIYDKHVKGMRVIGEGAYAKVYAKSRDRVIKVTTCSASWNYLQGRDRPKRSKHFPKVFKTWVETGENHSGEKINVYVIEMERLLVDFHASAYDSIIAITNEVDEYTYDPDFDGVGKTIKHAIDKVLAFAKDNCYSLDLHSGNFAMRGSVPVIIDPVT